MKAARDKAVAAGRGIILLPPAASFAFEEGMGNMLGSIVWEGAGVQMTHLNYLPKAGHEDDTLFSFGTGSTKDDDRFGPGLRGMLIEAGNAAAIAGNPIVIQFDGTLYAQLDNIRVKGFNGGTSWKFVMKGTAQHTRLNQVTFASCSQAWWVSNANTITATHLCLDSQDATTGPAAKFTGLQNLDWQGGMLQGNTSPMLLIQPGGGSACDSITLQELYVECFSGTSSGTVVQAIGSVGSVQGLKVVGGVFTTGVHVNKLFDFDTVLDFSIGGYRVYQGASLTLLKARSSKGVISGKIVDLLRDADADTVVDVDSSNYIVWRSSTGESWNTTAPTTSTSCILAGAVGNTIRAPYANHLYNVTGTPATGDMIYHNSGPGLWVYGLAGWTPAGKGIRNITAADTATSGTHTTPVLLGQIACNAGAYYLFRAYMPYITADTATAMQVELVIPGSGDYRVTYLVNNHGTYPQVYNAGGSGANTGYLGGSGAGTGPGATQGVAVFEGQIVPGAAGNVQVYFRSSDAAKMVTVKNGFNFELRERDY
jgi:hypothetical protein